jgi:hypothetical protein
VRHFYNKQDIVSSLDVVDFLFNGKPTPSNSRFYTTDAPSITTKRKHARGSDVRTTTQKQSAAGSGGQTTQVAIEQLQQQSKGVSFEPTPKSIR